MSARTARAVQIIEALNDFFQEHDGQVVLYSDAQILEEEISIKDAIAECVGMDDAQRETVVPRSQRRKYGYNRFNNTYSLFIGKNKVDYRFTEEAAIRWVNERD